MPEGPEVFALAYALRVLGVSAHSYGKHVFFADTHEDWSFGLSGTVALHAGVLTKMNKGVAPGRVDTADRMEDVVANHHLGVDWMSAPALALKRVVRSWATSEKSLAKLVLDQSHIAGIGVAWGSELLAAAGMDPSATAASQSDRLNKLGNVLVRVRDEILHVYTHYIANTDAAAVVNGWFKNLYALRDMKVYQKAKPLVVGNRKWWTKKTSRSSKPTADLTPTAQLA